MFLETVAEYKHCYGGDPTRALDHWWEFAKEHDFNVVVEVLAPFSGPLSGDELRRRAYWVGSTCSARGGSSSLTGSREMRSFVSPARPLSSLRQFDFEDEPPDDEPQQGESEEEHESESPSDDDHFEDALDQLTLHEESKLPATIAVSA